MDRSITNLFSFSLNETVSSSFLFFLPLTLRFTFDLYYEVTYFLLDLVHWVSPSLIPWDYPSWPIYDVWTKRWPFAALTIFDPCWSSGIEKKRWGKTRDLCWGAYRTQGKGHLWGLIKRHWFVTVDINKVTRCDFSEALNISLEFIWLFVSRTEDLFFEIMEWRVSRRYQGNEANKC